MSLPLPASIPVLGYEMQNRNLSQYQVAVRIKMSRKADKQQRLPYVPDNMSDETTAVKKYLPVSFNEAQLYSKSKLCFKLLP